MNAPTERKNQRKFLDGSRRANLAFVVTVVLFATIAVRNYLTHVHQAREERRTEFSTEAAHRQLRLQHLLESRRALLTSVVAYFGTSTAVTNEEFARYAAQLGPLPIDALCWHSLDRETTFAVGLGDGSPEACRAFDPQRPSRVSDGKSSLLVLSSVANTPNHEQRGYVSIVMAVDSLALEDAPRAVAEELIVEDLSHKERLAYRLQRQSSNDETQEERSRDALYFDLAQFGDMRLAYSASPALHDANRSPSEVLFSASVVVVGLLAGAYLRNLLTTRTKISEQVRVKTAELSQFAYRTTHDLRGPLVTVTGLCRAVREDLEQGELDEAKANVLRIEQRVLRLDHLVRDILDISRADVGQFRSEPLDVGALAAEVKEHVVSTLGTDAVRVDLSVECPRPVELPRTRLFQILNNLLSNSIKYANLAEPDPHVEVEVREREEHLAVTVRDNGLGIPAQYQDRLFQMFERFHPNVPAVGSGLGMSIIKRHVDHLNGSIEVSSTTRGTLIHIEIPIRHAREGRS